MNASVSVLHDKWKFCPLQVINYFYICRIFTGSTRLDGNAIGECVFTITHNNTGCVCYKEKEAIHGVLVFNWLQWTLCAGCVRCPWMSWPQHTSRGCLAYRRLWKSPTTTWTALGYSGLEFGRSSETTSIRLVKHWKTWELLNRQKHHLQYHLCQWGFVPEATSCCSSQSSVL